MTDFKACAFNHDKQGLKNIFGSFYEGLLYTMSGVQIVFYDRKSLRVF